MAKLTVKNAKNEVVTTIDSELIDSISASKLQTGVNLFALCDHAGNLKALKGFRKTSEMIFTKGNTLQWQDGEYKITCSNPGEYLRLMEEAAKLVTLENKPQRGRSTGSGKKLGMGDL